MKKEIELTLKDLQKYEELEKSISIWANRFISDIVGMPERRVQIEEVDVYNETVLVQYILPVPIYTRRHMNISYDVLLEYIEKYQNKK